MALDGKNYKPGMAIYTFIDEKGNNVHVDSELLRQWCAANREMLEPQCAMTPVDPKIAVSFLEDNVIDLKHAHKVYKMDKLDPIIYGKWGTETNGHPDVILIDGHHRYFCAFVARAELIPAYILEPEQWRHFEIIGLPAMTHEVLRQMPNKAQYQRLKEQGIEPVVLKDQVVGIKEVKDV